MRPPYQQFAHIPPTVEWSKPACGAFADASILVASPARVRPRRLFDEIRWLRATVPDVALAVKMPEPVSPVTLGSCLTRLARCGAVVVVAPSAGPAHVVRAVRESFDPIADLPLWLATVLPDWSADVRQRVYDELLAGIQYDPEAFRLAHAGRRLPSSQPGWLLAGRALRAASALQTEGDGGASDLQVALANGYADGNAMRRALKRAFLVSTSEIRETAGWEWLLWRVVERRKRRRRRP